MTDLSKTLSDVNALLDTLSPLDRARVVRSAAVLWECDKVWQEEERRLMREERAKMRAESKAGAETRRAEP